MYGLQAWLAQLKENDMCGLNINRLQIFIRLMTLEENMNAVNKYKKVE